tara:strand:- start:440 stop:763 length:324 start_codon:yes stop_codon:yes gene_type:complete
MFYDESDRKHEFDKIAEATKRPAGPGEISTEKDERAGRTMTVLLRSPKGRDIRMYATEGLIERWYVMSTHDLPLKIDDGFWLLSGYASESQGGTTVGYQWATQYSEK